MEYLLRTNISDYDNHWNSQYYHCRPDIIHYNAILKVENLKADFKKHFKRDLYTDRWSSSDDVTKKYFQSLNKEEFTKLILKYHADFVFFGYYHDQKAYQH